MIAALMSLPQSILHCFRYPDKGFLLARDTFNICQQGHESMSRFEAQAVFSMISRPFKIGC